MLTINPRHVADYAILDETHKSILPRIALKTKDALMHPADIKAALQKVRSSQAKVARELHTSETAVAHVIYGRSTSKRIAKLISKKTGLSLSQLWPGRYDKPNSPSK
jgi:lambda repressor-like predicted transcriptional regulator